MNQPRTKKKKKTLETNKKVNLIGKFTREIIKKNKPFLLGEELVFVHFTATAFLCVACTFFPLVRHYHLR